MEENELLIQRVRYLSERVSALEQQLILERASRARAGQPITSAQEAIPFVPASVPVPAPIPAPAPAPASAPAPVPAPASQPLWPPPASTPSLPPSPLTGSSAGLSLGGEAQDPRLPPPAPLPPGGQVPRAPSLTPGPPREYARREAQRPATPPIKSGPDLVTGLTVGAVVCLLLGLVYFLTVAIQNDWIGEGARCLLAGLAGLGVLALAWQLREREHPSRLWAPLAGLGIAGPLVGLTVAQGLYHLISLETALFGIGLASLAGMALAWEWRAPAITAAAALGASCALPLLDGPLPVSGALVLTLIGIVFCLQAVSEEWMALLGAYLLLSLTQLGILVGEGHQLALVGGLAVCLSALACAAYRARFSVAGPLLLEASLAGVILIQLAGGDSVERFALLQGWAVICAGLVYVSGLWRERSAANAVAVQAILGVQALALIHLLAEEGAAVLAAAFIAKAGVLRLAQGRLPGIQTAAMLCLALAGLLLLVPSQLEVLFQHESGARPALLAILLWGAIAGVGWLYEQARSLLFLPIILSALLSLSLLVLYLLADPVGVQDVYPRYDLALAHTLLNALLALGAGALLWLGLGERVRGELLRGAGWILGGGVIGKLILLDFVDFTAGQRALDCLVIGGVLVLIAVRASTLQRARREPEPAPPPGGEELRAHPPS